MHASIADVWPFAAFVFVAMTAQVEALRRSSSVEGTSVLLHNMQVEAFVVDIISTGWALVEDTLMRLQWPHNRPRAHGTSLRHCAWFDVAGRSLAGATATGQGNTDDSSHAIAMKKHITSQDNNDWLELAGET